MQKAATQPGKPANTDETEVEETKETVTTSTSTSEPAVRPKGFTKDTKLRIVDLPIKFRFLRDENDEPLDLAFRVRRPSQGQLRESNAARLAHSAAHPDEDEHPGKVKMLGEYIAAVRGFGDFPDGLSGEGLSDEALLEPSRLREFRAAFELYFRDSSAAEGLIGDLIDTGMTMLLFRCFARGFND